MSHEYFQQSYPIGGEHSNFKDARAATQSFKSNGSLLGYQAQSSSELALNEINVSKSTYFLAFFSAVNVFTILSVGAIIVVQVFCIIFTTRFTEPRDIYFLIYRLYGLGFSFIAYSCEMEWTEAIRNAALLQSWVSRGLFYVFVALFELREYAAIKWKLAFIDTIVITIGLFLISSGLIYTFMGLFCMEKIRDQKMARYMHILSNPELSKSPGSAGLNGSRGSSYGNYESII